MNRQRVTYQTAILPAAGILPRAELTIPEEMEGESSPSRGGGGEADGGVENGTRGVTRYRTVLTRDYVDNLVFENGELKYVITPTGFIEDGEYYHQLADYEGNPRVVVDNEGTVYERNNYYPFGLPIVDEHYASAITPYKYGGKEFDTMNGQNAYDFSARILDPTLCQFTTVDPLAEQYYPYSPYLYCAGNPVRYIDPSGKEWLTAEDKAIVTELLKKLSSKKSSILKKMNKLNNNISKNEKKNKSNKKNEAELKELTDKYKALNSSGFELSEMGQTKQKYFTFKQKQTITGKTEFDPNSSVVTMHISDGIYRNANAIHELKHAYDLWKGIYTYDLNSEIVAYQRQYAFDVNSMPSVIPNHFKDVNSSYVGRIV